VLTFFLGCFSYWKPFRCYSF